MHTRLRNSDTETERIRSVYSERDKNHTKYGSAWYLPINLYQDSIKRRMLLRCLKKVMKNLSYLNVLDVGCGTGEFLKLLLENEFHQNN